MENSLRRLVQALPRAKRMAVQFIYMNLGSALFFAVKIGCLYLAEQMGVASWLSYFVISIALTAVGWTYHSKVTFKAGFSSRSAARYVTASIALKVFDYLGFILLTYVGAIYPIMSAIIMSTLQVLVRYLAFSAYVFKQEDAI